MDPMVLKSRLGKVSLCVFLCVLLLSGSSAFHSDDVFALTGMCIRNCGHCKEIYGDYFNGQACAENCILTKGQAVPDCNDPVTFKRFLKKLI
ncbi:UNVERIFIED_CONTAM: hypothetical protein RMT77_008044 [Armadillidium vulgare]